MSQNLGSYVDDVLILSAQVPRMVAMTPSREDKMFLWPDEFSEAKAPALEQVNESVAA